MHLVYRIYDADERCLYIGQTNNLSQRIYSHTRQFWGGDHIVTIRLAYYVDEVSARLAERDAIKAEAPLYNVQHQEPEVRPVARARRHAGRPLRPPVVVPDELAVNPDFLWAVLDSKDYGLDEFVARVGISRNDLYLILEGDVRVRPVLASRMAQVLDVKPAALFPELAGFMPPERVTA